MSSTGTSRSWAVGGLIFAASMMIMLGLWQVMVGIAAIFRDEFFVTTDNYVFNLDTTAWGWLHLVLGALSIVVGAVMFTGATWTRVIGIALAGVSAINNFLFIPYYPLWSLAIIAADIFVIWSLCTVGAAVRAGELPGGSGPEYTGTRRDEAASAASAARSDVQNAPMMGR